MVSFWLPEIAMDEKSVRIPRKPKGERPKFFEDPAIDKLVTMVLSLAGEVAVQHDRHDTLERIIAGHGLVSRDEIETFTPSVEVMAERDRWRETFLGEVLRSVKEDREMLEQDAPGSYQSAVDAVAR
jgi:hypothetical protein